MPNQQIRSIANRLAAGWQSRLQHLETVLDAKSIHALAWRWRTELRVLRFLLSRYGDDPLIDDAAVYAKTPPAPLVLRLRLGAGNRPKSRQSMRLILDRIASANRTANI